MEEYDMSEQERRRRNFWPFLLLIVVLLLTGGGLFAWLVMTRQAPQQSSVGTNPHFSAATQPSATTKGTPPAVASDVRQQVAQKLYLSVDQLTAKLQAGVAIDSLAAQQGLSSDVWRAFVIATYQAAYEKEVRAGKVTQARADHDMRNIRSYPLDALNGWVTNDCLGVTSA